jgi:hypothetical protein
MAPSTNGKATVLPRAPSKTLQTTPADCMGSDQGALAHVHYFIFRDIMMSSHNIYIRELKLSLDTWYRKYQVVVMI